MLVPARTDTRAFHESLADGEVRFIRGGLSSNRYGEEQYATPLPSIVCAMGIDIKPIMKTVNINYLKSK